MFEKVKKIVFVFFILVFFVFSLTFSVSAESWPIVYDSSNLSEFLCSTNKNGGTLEPYYEIISGKIAKSMITKPYLIYSNYIDGDSVYAFFPDISVNDGCNYKFRIPFRTVSRDDWCTPERLSVTFCDYNLDSIYYSDLKFIKESTSGVYTLRDFVFEGTLSSEQFENILWIDIQAYGSSGDLNLGIIPNESIVFQQSGNLDSQYIVDNEKEMYEQEKQEAEQSGDDSVDGALSVMPNDSDGILQSFGKFIGCMLTTDTQSSIDFPALKTPAIGGLPSYTLTEKTKVNFNEIEEVIPESVLLIVRALLTIALIVFCYKELYSIIQFVVSLKKGGDSE